MDLVGHGSELRDLLVQMAKISECAGRLRRNDA